MHVNHPPISLHMSTMELQPKQSTIKSCVLFLKPITSQLPDLSYFLLLYAKCLRAGATALLTLR